MINEAPWQSFYNVIMVFLFSIAEYFIKNNLSFHAHPGPSPPRGGWRAAPWGRQVKAGDYTKNRKILR
jgi:hypothetical protein